MTILVQVKDLVPVSASYVDYSQTCALPTNCKYKHVPHLLERDIKLSGIGSESASTKSPGFRILRPNVDPKAID